MTDTEKKYYVLKKSVKKHENGDAASLMHSKGMPYKVIHGLSLSDIKTVASGFDKNAEFADILRQKDVREYKILADFLDEPDKTDKKKALEIIHAYKTSEQAELGGMFFLKKLPFAVELAGECMKSDELYTQMTGFVILAHKIKEAVEVNQEYIRFALELFPLMLNKADINLLRNYARLLRTVAAKDKMLKQRVENLFSDDTRQQNKNFVYFKEEVLMLI